MVNPNNRFDLGLNRSGLLDLLDRPDNLPGAIEDQLVGPDVGELVRALEPFQESGTSSGVLAEALLQRIVGEGLAGLTDAEFATVMRHPRCLLQIQKAILTQPSPYWDEVMARVDGTDVPMPLEFQPTEKHRLRPSWFPWAVSGVAAAAAVSLVVYQNRAGLDARDRLLEEANARNQAILNALQSLQRHYDPTDLPEAAGLTRQNPDPSDLPDLDPDNLPEAPRQHPATS